MPNFAEPVSIFMTTPVHTIPETASLNEADETMSKLGITSLAAVDADANLKGVITLTDLLASGLRNAGNRQDAALLDQSGKRVDQIMTPDVLTVDIETSLADAARKMVEARVHRVFVTARGDIAGVISTRDIMSAVEQVRVNKPVSQFMSTPVFTIRASETVSMAAERLGKAHVTGLIVVDESQWPVGIFSQREALEAKDEARATTVEQVMNPAVLTLPDHTAIHHVAKQALAMNAKRVAVMNKYELVGIMTGVDFAKAIS
jgi:CBS domain-containing protein